MTSLAQTINSWIPWIVGGSFAALFVAERLRPLRRRTAPSFKRWGLNLLAIGLAFAVAAVTVGPVIETMTDWTVEHRIGLLHLLPLPWPLALLLGVLLLDLSFYYWHRLNHAVPILWRFHNVHHIDLDLDSTTSFRFHVGEIAYSAIFRALQIVVIGPALLTVAVYQLLFLVGTVFHHSNIKLPLKLERALNWVVVTPRMHGVHHSVIRDETNSNYSVVFRWWDALHRTLRLKVPQNSIRIGVAGYTRDVDNSLADILWLPFQRQREYWVTPDGASSKVRADGDSAGPERLTG